jgi:glucosamine-6-phosphate deaminase
MQFTVHASAEAASRALAAFLADAITHHPKIVIGLPTGRTPVQLYGALVALHRAGRADFRRVTIFNVDEFVGLPDGHPGAYAAFMRQHLFQHVNVAPDHIHMPRSGAGDPRREARRYEAAIAAKGGIDIMVLGIGANGHIGFNEPGASLPADTHVARLWPATRRANAASFGGNWRTVPRLGISMGVGTLLRARHVVLLATGASKSRVVRRALEGPVTTRVPASLLQLHPDAIVVLDRAAAAGVSRRSRP